MKFTGLDSLLAPIAGAFAKGKTCRFNPLPFSAAALLAVEMQRFFKRPVALITESAALMDEMRRNLSAFAAEADETILDYPPREIMAAGEDTDIQPLITGERLRALARIESGRGPFLLNTCVQALMQKTAAPAFIKKNSLQLAAGREFDPERLAGWLEKAGYEFVAEVQERSQTVRRGGLIDVWPPSEPSPLRIEFDGIKIESIRYFDPLDQRSFAKNNQVILPPASEADLISSPVQKSHAVVQNPPWPSACPELVERATPPKEGSLRTKYHDPLPGGVREAGGGTILDSLAAYLPKETIFFWSEKYRPDFEKGARQYSGIACHAELHEKSCHDSGRLKTIVHFSRLIEMLANRQCRQCFSVFERFAPDDPPLARLGGVSPLADEARVELGFRPLQDIEFTPQSFLTPDIAQETRRRWLALLEKKAREGVKVHFFFGTPGAIDRFRQTIGHNLFHPHLGAISDGFLHDDLRFAVVSESGLLLREKALRRHFEIKAQRAAARRSIGGETITDWANIEPGDLVVHVNHGIGKYLGLSQIVFNGQLQETLAIEYAAKAKLYVPVSQAHLVSRYVMAGGRKSKIHQLGGGQWPREKRSAENAIYDMAAALLETQALRETYAGFAFPADTAWQHDFEAAFPYEETDDQEKAIAEVKADLESPAPTDRLICGDAGYGKTEVALRAAFKAVMAGKQVAILVPTTVLALQHFELFQQRMQAYPVKVELLCRFRSVAEQQRAVNELKKGVVDIVIGTHRLLQADIGFKDLGLIIIDEEQRFGVVHKERLKELKKLADVITLSATPIPRTLYMSLTGAKKISMVQTPPKKRLPIETFLVKNEDRLVREAILREINRGGQVFYLHNRVATIEKKALLLQQVVPEARIATAHGQMAPHALAEIMHGFARGDFDVLLCTTIVESGVDLPNVNTIFIDRADRFGIADLYQLRGRVGRSDRKAYAYLLIPVHGHLLDVSRHRLQAIMEHSKLGAGFRLAMMDLEIRGAGNLLGAEQSGHIAAIGFDLYCQLLRRAIESVKNAELGPQNGRLFSGRDASPRHPHKATPRQGFGRLGEPSLPVAGLAEAGRAGSTLRPCSPRPELGTKAGPATPPTTLIEVAQASDTAMVDVEVNLDFISLAIKNMDPGASAFLPFDYIEEEQTRVAVYRKIASAATPDEINSLRREFRDRFGPLPPPFERSLKIAAIRALAAAQGISKVESKEGKIMFNRGGQYFQLKNQFPRLKSADADGKLEEIMAWLKKLPAF